MSLSIRDISGNVISAGSSLFGTTILQNNNIYQAIFRLYNNYSALPNIAHVYNVKIYISTHSGITTIFDNIGDPYQHSVAAPLLQDWFSGTCTFSSQENGSVSNTMISAFKGLQFTNANTIYASGSNNYNQYTIQVAIPPGTFYSANSNPLYLNIEYETFL